MFTKYAVCIVANTCTLMNNILNKKNTLVLILLLCAFQPVAAQSEEYIADRAGTVDLFIGADLMYRDIYHSSIYEFVVNLTPGVKWNIGKQWQLAGQAIVPVYNDYGDRYKKVRLNMAVLSKELDWNRKQFWKLSGGLFGNERYGLDLKWRYPVNNWLALNAQAGLTGFLSMAVDWECSKMQRVTGWGGADFYINPVNTEIRIRGGRFLYEDYGVLVEGMRHFKHCTIGLYGQYSEVGKENGGFKIVMMIPPYKRSNKKVNFRPASNFRFTYNKEADPYSVKTYTTDPEENEREGDFDRARLKWGANRMKPDFTERRSE